jgi:hypothetical protein
LFLFRAFVVLHELFFIHGRVLNQKEMCILALAVSFHPSLPLVLIHNREEDLTRPTLDPCGLSRRLHPRKRGTPPSIDELALPVVVPAPLPPPCRYCVADPDVVCGRDDRAGGTWLGLNRRTGQLVALTNFRMHGDIGFTATSATTLRSRGDLVLRWLHDMGMADELTLFPSGSSVAVAQSSIVEAVNTSAADQIIRPLRVDDSAYGGYTACVCNVFKTPVGQVPPVLLTGNHPPYRPEHEVAEAKPSSSSSDETSPKQNAPHWPTQHVVMPLPPASVTCWSNSYVNDPEWPKCAFWQHALTAVLQATPPLPDDDPLEPWLADVVYRLAHMMCCVHPHTGRCTCDTSLPCAFSDHFTAHHQPCDVESCMCGEQQSTADAIDRDHCVCFFPHRAHVTWSEGTRAQTIVLQTATSVIFVYRNLDGYTQSFVTGDWQWEVFPRPI